MDFKSKIVLIYGPTASGKSFFSVKLAKKINGEIINIGSGKPIKIRNLIIKICKLVGSGNPQFGKIQLRKDEIKKYYNLIKFEDSDATFYEYENCSLITSIFTLQFIPKSKRKDLLKNIYDGLNCGGAYIFAEKTMCENALVQDMITFNYYDYKRKSFTTEDIMDKERTLRHMMKPNTWKEIEGMLTEVGFNVIQPFWRNHAFVGALAVK